MRRTPFVSAGFLVFLAAVAPATAHARDAAAAAARSWVSRVAYFNPSAASGTLMVDYVAQGTGARTPAAAVPVGAWASGSLLVGDTVNPFAGAAAVRSDLPLAAIYRMESAGKARTAGLSYVAPGGAAAGTGSFFVPAVVRGRRASSLVAVQNLEAGDVNVTLEFFTATAGPIVHALTAPVPPLASGLVSLADVAALGANFKGSLVVRAARVSDGAPARVLAAVQQSPASGAENFAFEGLAGTAAPLLVPAASCVAGMTNTFLSVQNAGAVQAEVSVDFYYSFRLRGVTRIGTTRLSAGSLAPGRALQLNACRARGVKGKALTTAVVTAKDGAGNPVPLAAAARVVNRRNQTLNAFAAQAASVAGADGRHRLAFPVLTRGAVVDVMNAGVAGAGVAAPKMNATLTYYTPAGAVAAVKPLSAGTRVSTKSAVAGAALVESEQPLAGVVRLKQAFPFSDGYGGVEVR